MPDIFLSYASQDRERVRPLVERLEAHGWGVWWDRDIPPGMTWPDVIKEALAETRAMVVVWTEASVISRWVLIETSKGDERGHLIPVAFDRVEPPLQFTLHQAADLVEWDGSETDPEFRAVVRQLERTLGVPALIEPEPASEPPTAGGEPEADRATSAASSTDVEAEPEPLREESGAPEPETVGGAPPEPALGTESVGSTRPRDRQTPGASSTPTSTRPGWVKIVPLGAVVLAALAGWQLLPFSAPPQEPGESAQRPNEPTIEAFSASATSVPEGGSVTLTWSTADADRAELRPGGPVALDGSTTLRPPRTTDYVLTASGPGGDTEQSIRIAVVPATADPPTASLAVGTREIERGASTTLEWSTTNASMVRLNGESVGTSDRRRIQPTGTVTYRLVVTGPGGTVEREVSVRVTEPRPVGPVAPPGAADPLNRAVWIEGGSFEMGHAERMPDQQPVHRVTLSGFWIQEHEVTNEEYRRFVPGHSFPNGQERHPVTNVSWEQAQAYAESRSGSLPTEAQWEFTARGTRGRTYPWGETEPNCRLVNSGCGASAIAVMSHPAGATPEGVNDLAGNVMEWVYDWYGTYSSEAQLNPTGPPNGGTRSFRVTRGGSANLSGGANMGTSRFNFPGIANATTGFRVAWPGR